MFKFIKGKTKIFFRKMALKYLTFLILLLIFIPKEIEYKFLLFIELFNYCEHQNLVTSFELSTALKISWERLQSCIFTKLHRNFHNFNNSKKFIEMLSRNVQKCCIRYQTTLFGLFCSTLYFSQYRDICHFHSFHFIQPCTIFQKIYKFQRNVQKCCICP